MKELISKAYVLRDCFAEDPHTPVAPVPKQEKVYLAEEKTTDFFKGESRRMVYKDYPITDEYVRSFVDAVDYKSGVASAMPPRQNLGDVREAQKMAHRDTMDVKSLIADLQSKLDALKVASNSSDKEVDGPSDKTDGGSDNG